MFTGIIEATGKIKKISTKGANKTFTVEAPFASELKTGQSVAHNGVCLTITTIDKRNSSYQVTAIKETLKRSNLGELRINDLANLERCLKIGDRLDGHFVQGHVDTIAVCTSVSKQKGSHLFEMQIGMDANKIKGLLVPKGSITVNGVSLTLVDFKKNKKNKLNFSVAIIPHTFKHTNFSAIKKGDAVNIEFDILGKYLLQKISKS